MKINGGSIYRRGKLLDRTGLDLISPRVLMACASQLSTVGRVEGRKEDEFRDLVGSIVKWCGENHLQLNVLKTEIVMDFRRNKPRPLQSSGLQTWRQSTRRA